MDASTFFAQPPHASRGNAGQPQQQMQQQTKDGHQYQQYPTTHFQQQQQHHHQVFPAANPPTAQHPHQKHHVRTTSHTSHGSHASQNSAVFETCDLDNTQEFFKTSSPHSSSLAAMTMQPSLEVIHDSGAGGGSRVARGGRIMTAATNEDFSNYNKPSTATAGQNSNNNNNNDNNYDEDHVYYEGVALQTALSAFGNVASAVGGMASNVRGMSSQGRAGGGLRSGVMQSLSMTPGRLANNMSSWRGKLAEVVAPVEKTGGDSIGGGTDENVGVISAPGRQQDQVYGRQDQGQGQGQVYGQQGREVHAVNVFGSAPSDQEFDWHLQQQQPPPLPAGYSEIQLSGSQPIQHQQEQSAAQDVFGTVPPATPNQLFPPTPATMTTDISTTHPNYNPTLANPSPNSSSSSWQIIGSDTTPAPCATDIVGNSGHGAAVTQPTAIFAGTEFSSQSTQANQQYPAQQQYTPLSHQMSSLENAKHDSSTFQYSDPLVGNVGSAATYPAVPGVTTEIPPPPPTAGVNAMEIGKYIKYAAMPSNVNDVNAQGAPLPSVDGAVLSTVPAMATDMFVSHSSKSTPIRLSGPSSNQMVISQTIDYHQPSSTSMALTAPSSTEAFSSQPPATSTALTGPSSIPAAQPPTSLPPKSIPSAPRSGNRRLQLSIPKKANLPLPPPMPRKKHHLLTPTNSVPGTAASSLGGDSRSSHRGFAVPLPTSHFKKPPPMEVSASSPRFATPSVHHRFHTPNMNALDGKKIAEMSPLPSPKLEWLQDPVEVISVAPLEEDFVGKDEERTREISKEAPVLGGDDVIVQGYSQKGTTESMTRGGGPPAQLPPESTESLSSHPIAELQHGRSSPHQGSKILAQVPEESNVASALPNSINISQMTSPEAVQDQESESFEDWNIITSTVVQEVLHDAVLRVATQAETPSDTTFEDVGTMQPSSHTPTSSYKHVTHAVTFSATAPPVYHGQLPDTESSRVTECDAMSDYQSFVKDEDVPPIREEMSDDDDTTSSPPIVMNHAETPEPGVVVDSSMVAECDECDYPLDLKEEDFGLAPNQLTNDTQPSGTLAEGWIEGVDAASGRVYFYNPVLQQSSWEKPIAKEKRPSTLIEMSEPLEEIEGIRESPQEIDQSPEPLVNEIMKDGKPIDTPAMYTAPKDPLPPGWNEGKDEDSGRSYYYNAETGQSSWDRPSLGISQQPSLDAISSMMYSTISTDVIKTDVNECSSFEPAQVEIPSERLNEYADDLPEKTTLPSSGSKVSANVYEPKIEETTARNHDDLPLSNGGDTETNRVMEQSSELLPSEIIDDQVLTGSCSTPAVFVGPMTSGWTEELDEGSRKTGGTSWGRPSVDSIDIDKNLNSLAVDLTNTDANSKPSSKGVEVQMTHDPARYESEERTSIDVALDQDDVPYTEKVDDTVRDVIDDTSAAKVVPLPDGWFEAMDPTGKTFYFCQSTGRSTWDRPVIQNTLPVSPPGSEESCVTSASEPKLMHSDYSTAVKPEDKKHQADLTVREAIEEEEESPHDANASNSSVEALLPGRVQSQNPQLGAKYYYNEDILQTSWQKPRQVAIHENQSIYKADLLAETANEAPSELVDEDAETHESLHSPVDAGLAPDNVYNDDVVVREEAALNQDTHPVDPTALLPGWIEITDQTGEVYYYNEVTKESRWDRPVESNNEAKDESTIDAMVLAKNDAPSSSLVEPEIVDGDFVGDSQTSETAGRLAEGKEALADVNTDIAANNFEHKSLPVHWLEAVDPSSGKIYFYNDITGVTSWERPVEMDDNAVDCHKINEKIDEPASDVTSNLSNEEESNEIKSLPQTSFNGIEDSALVIASDANETLAEGWVESKDPATGKVFYYNQEKGESSWDRPIHDPNLLEEEIVERSVSGVVTEPAESSGVTIGASKQEETATCIGQRVSPSKLEKTDAPEAEEELPSGWAEAFDPTTRTTYFYNEKTGESSWERPRSVSASVDAVAIENEVKGTYSVAQSRYDEITRIAEQDLPHNIDDKACALNDSSDTTLNVNKETKQAAWSTPVVPFTTTVVTSSTQISSNQSNRSRPAHAIAIFGFGGKLCVMIPQVAKSPSVAVKLSPSSECLPIMCRGPVVVHQLRNVIPCDHKHHITAHLKLPMIKARDEEVLSLLDEKCAATDGLIWDVVNIAAHNGGRLKEDKVESGQGPSSAVVDLLLSKNPTGSKVLHGDKNSLPQSPQVQLSSYVNTDLEEIQNLLMRGNREEAVDEALESKNYALALLIAAVCGVDTYQIVAQRFADEVLSPGSPLHTVALMLSQNLKLPSNEELTDPESESFWFKDIYDQLGSTWKCQLASILSNRKEGWNKIVLTLGDRLMQLGQFDGAHVCYLMCGCPIGTNCNMPTRLLLLGCDHHVPFNVELMTPESIESFLCTEAFEWARRKGNRRTCLQAFQPLKLRYAELLADFGYTELAREYVVSIRQLTGIGLDDHEINRAPPPSGNALVPVYPQEFIDHLYCFEDRLCISIGTELSCKKKKSEDYWKSKLAAITGGLGSVCEPKFSVETEHSKRKDSQQRDDKIDEPSSENEFVYVMDRKPDASSVAKSNKDARRGNVKCATAKTATSDADATKPPDSYNKPRKNAQSNVPKHPEDPKQGELSTSVMPTGDFPPASAPPSLGDDFTDKTDDHTTKEPFEKIPSPSSTPSHTSKRTDKKAPTSEPPRSGGWLSKLLGRDKESKARVADVGEEMQAYYDEKLKRWIFPGDDPAEVAKPLAPPPIMSPKAECAPAISSTPSASNDPLAALMAPPSRAMSSKKSSLLSSKARYADPLASMGDVTYSTTPGLPPVSSKNVPASPMRMEVSPAVTPKFAVFQPKPTAAIGGDLGDEREN